MQRPYYLILSLVLLLFSQTTFSSNCDKIVPPIDDPDTVCGVFDIWELEWLNDLIATADGNNIANIQQIGYDGAFYFQVNSGGIIADGPMYLYDCAGNLLCTFYYYTTEGCPFDVFEINTNSIEVWTYNPEPCICPAVYDPVCGMDGLTYGNACEAACAGVSIFEEGECISNTVCGVSDIWELDWLNQLIDETDGCTIGFIRQFEYNGATYFQANPGNEIGCIADADMFLYDCEGNLLCTFPYYEAPDCPFDVFAANNNSFQIWAYQPEDCICATVYDPVCGMDGNTYGNACEAACAGVGIFAEGECQYIEPPITVCGVTDIWELDWINELIATANGYNIGSIQQFDYNGETYFQVNPALTIADGQMDVYDCAGNLLCTFYYYTAEDCPFDVPSVNNNSIQVWEYECVCPDVYEPVCSAYGNTYDNECEAACVGAPIIYQGVCEEPTNTNVCEVSIKMFLQGALINTNDGLMRDDLRTNNMLPLTEPYSTSAYFTHVDGGGETTTSAVLNIGGQNAITDWVFLELRDAAFNLVKTRSALLQRDGDVVEVDGVSPINFNVPNGNYHVCVRHRNHLGTMTNSTMNISSTSATTVDFTNIATYGTNAQMAWNNNTNALWAGHTNNTGSISFQGIGNNINLLFFEVLGAPNNANSATNYIYDGYNEGDINMDGSTIYQGNNNDATDIFFTTIQHPQNDDYIGNFTIYQQMP